MDTDVGTAPPIAKDSSKILENDGMEADNNGVDAEKNQIVDLTESMDEVDKSEQAISKSPQETKDTPLSVDTVEVGNAAKGQPLVPGLPLSPPSSPRKSPLAKSVSMSSTASGNRRVSKRIKIKRKSRPTPKIFHDAISVVIPLNVTADLKKAIQHTRNKRIQSIYKRFPALKKAIKKSQQQHQQNQDLDDVEDDGESGSKGDDPMEEDDEMGSSKKSSKAGDDKENAGRIQKKKKKLENVPRPEAFGSVLDYLEAKYVRGVMLGDDEDEGQSLDDASEGHGSVYSGGSFLDDTDLQRDVAEQVMANTTLTKLELEDDDGEFFVNVGNLEIEENQYGENYDPAQDKDMGTKKRKKPAGASTDKTATKKKKTTASKAKQSGASSSTASKKTSSKPDVLAESSKSKKSTTSTASQKSKGDKATKGSTPKPKKGKTASSTDESHKEVSEDKKKLLDGVKKAKAKSDRIFDNISNQVKSMTELDLPRRITKLKVALTCPPNKKPGDDITFANPHNPGQRLRVKVPKDTFPGGTFKVSVPVKPKSEEEALDNKDHNNFGRDFQEAVDDYARAYDDWCRKQHEVDRKFALFKEKQAKFDPIIALFPKDLKTPITVEYMKKIVRRARQNKHKRLKMQATKQDGPDEDVEENKIESKQKKTPVTKKPAPKADSPKPAEQENNLASQPVEPKASQEPESTDDISV